MLGWTFFFSLLSTLQCAADAPTYRQAEDYRNFSKTAPLHVQEFYRDNHTKQTLAFVQKQHSMYLPPKTCTLTVWEVVELLGALVDESDPDMHLPQYVHSYQTAEALRLDGHPRWLVLVGFIHDLGKILACFGQPQWAVVGDTFPVGCAYAKELVFPEFFVANPDQAVPLYQTKYGIYSPACGFDQLIMSWGHDEYLYQVVKDFLPKEAAYIIRFHSFYAAHQLKAYDHLMNDLDRQMMPWLELFSQYDLYSKHEQAFDCDALKPYYRQLVEEFFKEPIRW